MRYYNFSDYGVIGLAKSRKDTNGKPEVDDNTKANMTLQNGRKNDMGAAPESENARYLLFCRRMAKLPAVDLQDPSAVEKRVEAYLRLCGRCDRKPAVSGLAMALDLDRRQLSELCGEGGNGRARLPAASLAVIRRAYRSLELLWEQYLLDGLIGSATGIFLGKNQFAYQDKSEMAVTAWSGPPLTGEELARRAERLRAGLADDGE